MILYFIISIIIFCSLIGIIIINTYNKFQFALIKIEEAENSIDNLLRKKKDLMYRFLPFIKDKDEQEEKQLKKMEELKNKTINNFELHHELIKNLHEINLMLDHQSEISANENFNSLKDELMETNEDIDASIKYYNDNVVKYNRLIKCFPSNLTKLIFKFKEKEFYSNAKEEPYEILKTK